MSADLAVPTEPAPPPLVSIRHLHKTFGSFAAVQDLTLDVQRGEILALLGPNGAGKTTTIRMLMGILSPTSGAATIAGHACFAERAAVMQHVGYLPDEPMFHDHLRGGEIVRFCGTMRGMPATAVRSRLDELATRLDLDDALDEYAVNYSMGMKKKLALVCAMLHRPAVLILDEPTNGLDPVVTRALLDLVRETAASGTAVFYSTHLLEQAERLCHRVAILHRGQLAALGTPAALRSTLAPGGSLEDVFFQVATGQTGAAPAPEPGS
ncbi:MAG: ABC transporter ATP-binding protein [Planctomycetes bacterium]|nr:ABC transporter ATP-binding protein [Planctomycetota bacterium]MCC7396591.1 ABC transporter ATP-binding protein [Planctomycetota bacterium]